MVAHGEPIGVKAIAGSDLSWEVEVRFPPPRHSGIPLSGGLPQAGSKVDLLRNLQRVVHFNAEISHGAL